MHTLAAAAAAAVDVDVASSLIWLLPFPEPPRTAVQSVHANSLGSSANATANSIDERTRLEKI